MKIYVAYIHEYNYEEGYSDDVYLEAAFKTQQEVEDYIESKSSSWWTWAEIELIGG